MEETTQLFWKKKTAKGGFEMKKNQRNEEILYIFEFNCILKKTISTVWYGYTFQILLEKSCCLKGVKKRLKMVSFFVFGFSQPLWRNYYLYYCFIDGLKWSFLVVFETSRDHKANNIIESSEWKKEKAADSDQDLEDGEESEDSTIENKHSPGMKWNHHIFDII